VSYDSKDVPVLHYRPKPDSDWQPVPASLAGYSIDALYFDKDHNIAYAKISDKREPTRFYRIDFGAATRELLQGRDDVDIGSVLTGGYEKTPFGVHYSADKPSIRYFDNTS